MNKLLGVIALTLPLLLVPACTLFPPLAGIESGSETTNGYVVGSLTGTDGSPVMGTRVKLIRASYNPVKDGPVPDSLTGTTGEEGDFMFHVSGGGVFNIEGLQQTSGYRVLITGIAVNKNDTAYIPAQAIKKPGVIKVVLPDTLDTTNGYVFIPGTTIFAPLGGSKGFVILDSVPAGTIPSIFYAAGTSAVSTRSIADGLVVMPGTTTTAAGSGWKYSKKLYFNTTASGAGVRGDVCNFPVLVRLTDSNFVFSQANGDGGDLRFTKSDGSPLSFEIEQWDAVQKRAAIWVKTDTVYGNDSTHFMSMVWGNPGVASASNSAAVFDTAHGFAGVWHFADTCADATADRNDGADFGTVPSPGIVGNARGFNGIDAYVKVADPASGSLDFGMESFSYSLWVHVASSADSFDVAWSKGGTNPGSAGYCVKLGLGDWNTAICDGTTMVHGAFGMERDFLGGWTLLSVVVDRDLSLLKTFANGTMTDRIDIHTLGPLSSTLPASIGMEDVSYFKGVIDELRVSRGALSTDWVRLSYANQGGTDRLVVSAK
jgi:hypothetical protein